MYLYIIICSCIVQIHRKSMYNKKSAEMLTLLDVAKKQ